MRQIDIMYEQHFGLTKRPFSIAPDPRFLYMSQQHREALAHLLYGVGEGGGFVQLTGEVGTGKTTTCRCLLEQLPKDVNVALILNPRVTELELIASVCDELGIEYAKDTSSIKELTDLLTRYLLDCHASGRRTVLMIDEAQNLSAEALEQVRLLTNLETSQEKLLQIILIGQPELREVLAREDLRQLSQRITARFHLEAIPKQETAAYIRHRLQICGTNTTIFSDKAIDRIQKLSQGVPRLINVLCDRAMLGAFVEGRHSVDLDIVNQAGREVMPEEILGDDVREGSRWWLAAVVLAGLGVGIYLGTQQLPWVIAQARALISVKWLPQANVEPTMPPISTIAKVESELFVIASNEESLDQEVVLLESKSESEAGSQKSLIELLNSASPQASSHAWAGLYQLWGYRSDAVTDKQACLQASYAGLRCLQASGSWSVLRNYDRPALLLLVASEGRRVPVLLEHLDGAQASLKVDGHSLQVNTSLVEQYWYGEYRVLWKMPPAGSTVLRPGERNKDIRWLRERLQSFSANAVTVAEPDYYDDDLKKNVAAFQRSRTLNADGVAGSRTFIHLNNIISDEEIPRLLPIDQDLRS